MRILLAGGSGGLGRATVELLTTEGAHLVVSYLSNAARAEELRTLSPDIEIVQADITKQEDRDRLLSAAGPIDGLVVFTGNPARVAAAAQMEQQMIASHAVNYLGPLLLAREAAERMKQSKIAGSIVLFSTMQGVALFSGSTAYAGVKAALIHGARILAKELRAPHNIRVNVIAPGIIDSGMAQVSIRSGKYDKFISDETISRFGRGGDIARAVRFLLEPDSYVTGQVISVDGGITL